MDGLNDNDPAAPAAARGGAVLTFPTEWIERRRAALHRLTHHEAGTPLSADELAAKLKLAAIGAAAERMFEFALEDTDGDPAFAAAALIAASKLADQEALIYRAERILGSPGDLTSPSGPEAA